MRPGNPSPEIRSGVDVSTFGRYTGSTDETARAALPGPRPDGDRTMHTHIRLAMLYVVTLTFPGATIAADMPGASDHPRIPRVAGSDIYGYAQSQYDVAAFVAGMNGSQFELAQPEGRRTRILYIAKSGDSPLMVQKNYEAALDALGDVQEVYACRANECSGRFSTHLWGGDSIIPTEGLPQARYLIGFSHNYQNPTYRYARVDVNDARLHVGVFAATIASNNANPDVRGQTAVLLEVLEEEDFEPTLEFVDAATMRNDIDAQGYVTLYGIYFDHDRDTLRAESGDTIAEIAKALGGDQALSLYVVGHTDGVGALDYNQDLSLRRARAVVAAIVALGISGDRLTPVGVGPVSPVANNATEEGRALNRRVELVERL